MMKSARSRIGQFVLDRNGAEEHAAIRHDSVLVFKKQEGVIQEEFHFLFPLLVTS